MSEEQTVAIYCPACGEWSEMPAFNIGPATALEWGCECGTDWVVSMRYEEKKP